MIEVEHRSLLSEDSFAALTDTLNIIAQNKGRRDMRSWFYVFDDKLVKVAENVQDAQAKLVIKSTSMSSHHASPEIELPIAITDVELAKQFCLALGQSQAYYSLITRRDFTYKDVEIACKYSKRWGFHVELEQMVEDESLVASANHRIVEVATELGVELLDNTQETELRVKFANGIELGDYKEDALPFEI